MGTNKVISSKSIGEKVKFRRQDIGMSQESLAVILELSYQQIQRYENGRNKISVERIQEIANALAVPVSYFFDTDFNAPLPVPVINYIPSEEEKTLLKHFKQIERNPDRQAVVLVARRLASKK
jgi:transcriptional regulator with XRE-family HTH domain